jgi:hypothetical protein
MYCHSKVFMVQATRLCNLVRKANQAVTSNSMPNADPTNIDLLRAKHPEPAHPDSDPVRLS